MNDFRMARVTNNSSPDDEERSTEFRNIHQDNQSLLTWNISLADDQDEVSENFLMMHNKPTRVNEELFGPGIFAVPENIRKLADEIFKHTAIDPNTLFNFTCIKSSWILQSSYQQYLKFLSPRELEKKEKHVLYPWTQWKWRTSGTVTPPPPHGTTPFSSSSSSSLSSSLLSPLSSFSSSSPLPLSLSSSSLPSSAHVSYRSPPVAASDLSPFPLTFHHRSPSSSPLHARATFGRPFDDAHAANNCSFSPFSSSSSPSPSFPLSPSSPSSTSTANGSHRAAAVHASVARLSRPRLYYSVDADNNNVVVNKLVEPYCTFCYKNREPPEVYGTHLVRDGNRTTCPKLRALRCRRCNSTGDNAHTIKYCPCLYINYCG